MYDTLPVVIILSMGSLNLSLPSRIGGETASCSSQREELIQWRHTHHSDTCFRRKGLDSCTWKCPPGQGSSHHVHRGWTGMDLRHGRSQCLQWAAGEKPPACSSTVGLLPKWGSNCIASDWEGQISIALLKQGRLQSHNQSEGCRLDGGQARRNRDCLPSAFLIEKLPFSIISVFLLPVSLGVPRGLSLMLKAFHKPEDLPYSQCPGVEVRTGERTPTPNETQAFWTSGKKTKGKRVTEKLTARRKWPSGLHLSSTTCSVRFCHISSVPLAFHGCLNGSSLGEFFILLFTHIVLWFRN